MGVDLESFQDVLKHPIRRRIILALGERQPLSYMDLMGVVEAENTGKFNYHLRILADLIQKGEGGKYGLSEKGQLAAQFLKTFKEKKVEPSPLGMADALLIGFAGFTLTLANPGFWVFMRAASMNVQSVPLFFTLQILSVIFALIAPGALMWRLAVRRSRSHDAYDLYKPSLWAFAMLLPLLVTMLVFHVNIGAQAIIQVEKTVGPNWSAIKNTVIPMNLFQIIMYGLIFSFVGVALAERASRFKRKLTLRQ